MTTKIVAALVLGASFSLFDAKPTSIAFPDSHEEADTRFVLTSSPQDKERARRLLAAGIRVRHDFVNYEPPQSEIDKCVSDGFSMPGYNATLQQFECYALTGRGPCKESEWWTLSAFGRGECTRMECEFSEVKMDGSCIALKSIGPCPRGMEVGVNPHGQGECSCKEGFIPHRDSITKFVSCYQEYLRGPCPAGEQYMVANATTFEESGLDDYYDYYEDGSSSSSDSEEFEVPLCVPHSCPSDSPQVRWKNGECFEEVGCLDEVVFNEDTKTTSCPINLRTVIVVPEVCNGNAKMTADGECREVFDLGNERRTRKLALRTKSLARYLRLRRGRGSM